MTELHLFLRELNDRLGVLPTPEAFVKVFVSRCYRPASRGVDRSREQSRNVAPAHGGNPLGVRLLAVKTANRE